jgi:uncharacterized membrane protein
MGLWIRVLVLCTVVFAIVYGVTRALRANASTKEARRIAYEIEKLREAVARGAINAAEYTDAADRIRRDCERLGIPVPSLPRELPPPASGDS